jgi:hypothetical protein
MPFTPTPRDQWPSLDELVAQLDPESGEGTSGYITPDDVKLIVQTLLSADVAHAAELGDPTLITASVPEHDLVHYLLRLEQRIVALENADAPVPVTPAEARMTVDNYGGGFVRLMFDGSAYPTVDLWDKQPHRVDLALATAPGPGGAVIPDLAALTAMGGATWFDKNGSLGKVIGSSGADISHATLAQWIQDPKHIITVTFGDADPAHPTLTVSKVEAT